MKTLQLELGPRSYPIFIGADLIDKHALLTPYLPTAQVMIVSNETVAPLYLARVTAQSQRLRCRQRDSPRRRRI